MIKKGNNDLIRWNYYVEYMSPVLYAVNSYEEDFYGFDTLEDAQAFVNEFPNLQYF